MSHSRSSRLGHIYGAALLLALHSAFTVYISSNFLGQYLSNKSISILYTTAAFETLIGLILIPHLIRRFGAFAVYIIALVLQIFALTGMATTPNIALLAVFFIIYQMLPSLMYFLMDIFLENLMLGERHTGQIRSNYLTILNAAFLISPFVVGQIVTVTSYEFIYFLAATFISALLILVVIFFGRKKTRSFKDVHFSESLNTFHYRHGLVKVFTLNLLLYGFYATMVIYTPLYLHQTIGFDWITIGALFTIMLLPFVLFEAPLGRFFDRAHKEKGVMIVGFFFMAMATAAIFATNSRSFIVWAALLFLSRVGASFVEIGTEYSFFKRVDDRDAGIISVFRTASPISYIFTPLCAAALMMLFPMEYIFLALSLAMLSGMIVAAKLNKLHPRVKAHR